MQIPFIAGCILFLATSLGFIKDSRKRAIIYLIVFIPLTIVVANWFEKFNAGLCTISGGPPCSYDAFVVAGMFLVLFSIETSFLLLGSLISYYIAKRSVNIK